MEDRATVETAARGALAGMLSSLSLTAAKWLRRKEVVAFLSLRRKRASQVGGGTESDASFPLRHAPSSGKKTARAMMLPCV